MKKSMALLVCLCLTLICATALAAGELTVVQEVYLPIVHEGYCNGYLFVEMTNTGDEDVAFDSGTFDILTAEGEKRESASIHRSRVYPSVLAPGETGYFCERTYCGSTKGLEDVQNYALTMTSKAPKRATTPRVDATATLLQADGRTTVTVMMSNTTGQEVKNLCGAYAVYDAEGKLIYVDSVLNISTLLLPDGQTAGVWQDVDSDISEYWAANGITPATLKAIVFVSE